MEEKIFSHKIGGQTLKVTFSNVAPQANRSLLVQYGDTVILVTATMSHKPRPGADFFPLMIDYEEKFYAAGKMIGSRFIKREGRPSEEAVLSGRMIDRCIRPLFDDHLRHEVQIVITILSLDEKNDADIMGMFGASLALATSDIPWNGPIGAVRVGKEAESFILNPSFEQRKEAALDLVVSGSSEKINMLEGKGKEIKEEEFVEALKFAAGPLDELLSFQNKIIKEVGKEKQIIERIQKDADVHSLVRNFDRKKIERSIYVKSKEEGKANMKPLEEELVALVKENFPENADAEKEVILALDDRISEILHENMLKDGQRPDGRGLDEVRKISCRIDLLPRVHGSALFERGTTQALSIVTLGSPGDEQTIDTMEKNDKKRFMHHYNFPPYSVGEVGRMGGAGRREIGHGALAEKALEPILPPKETFPYTIRLVSEIVSSNGSSSMASVCGSSLSLMAAGVPITRPAAGIAMGLITGADGNYKILTDIQGPEDHHGDMDFKSAGTRNGLTAIQMDVKIEGVKINILKEVIFQAKKAKEQILDTMEKTLAGPREDLSQYAPRIITIQIPVDKIREVIGPGGKVINEIIDKTGVSIDIEQTGSVYITSVNQDGAKRAVEWIKNITREPEIGEQYEGKVIKIVDFGAFVEILPGKEGLLHISEISNSRVNKVEDVLKEGQIINVKVIRTDKDNGKISLTMKK